MKHPERRQRDHDRNREDILLAAGRAFARSGVGQATMQDIAGEAGYTAASLYTYFASKQEILEGLGALVNDELHRSFSEPLPTGLTLGQRLEVLLTRQLDVLEGRREVLYLFLNDAALACGRSASRSRPHPLELRIQLMTDWLRTQATGGELGECLPEDAARLLVGIVYAFVHGWMHGTLEGSLLPRVPDLLGWFWSCLRPGHGPEWRP